MLKSDADRDLIEACRAALRGETFLYPPTMRTLPQAWLADPSRAPASQLTPREEEVVKLVAESYTSDEIGRMLQITRRTVERHRENMGGVVVIRAEGESLERQARHAALAVVGSPLRRRPAAMPGGNASVLVRRLRIPSSSCPGSSAST